MDQEEFEKLGQEEQEKIFHQTPFWERSDLLLRAHNPAKLAQSLSQEELYLMTREMDLEESSEILRYASLPQLFFISDMKCWKKDRLNTKSFVGWLETLKEADEQRLLAWLVEMDYEAVMTGFRGVIRVIKPEWEYPSDELLGDEPYFTLDERYFISVKEENLETVRRAIEILFENHRRRYIAILEGILGELEYELEEEAFQNRARRLAERGFPDPETAQHIYRPISPDEYEHFPRKNSSAGNPQRDSVGGFRPPHYLVLRSKERLFFDEVLLLFREDPAEVQERLEEEVAWLSNKIIACEGIDFASEERVRRGVERARSFISIGLENLSGRDLTKARDVMREKWLEIVFRWGVTRILELRDEARRIVEIHWGSNRKPFLQFLDSPYEAIFKGLFLTVPQYHDAEILESTDPLRDFKSTNEIEKTRRAVLQIARIHEWFNREWPALIPRLNIEIRRDDSQGTLFSTLGTLFATFIVEGKSSSRALTQKELVQFLKRGFETQGPRRVLAASEKEKFLSRFFPVAEQDLLRPLWGLAFQKLEEELGRVDLAQKIDNHFVTTLCLR